MESLPSESWSTFHNRHASCASFRGLDPWDFEGSTPKSRLSEILEFLSHFIPGGRTRQKMRAGAVQRNSKRSSYIVEKVDDMGFNFS